MGLSGIAAVSCNFTGSQPDKNFVPVSKNEKYLYLDLDGKVVINPQFTFASYFNEGLALVHEIEDTGKFGFIDYSGKYVIEPEYVSATLFSEGIAWVAKTNGAPIAIDKTGKMLFKLQEANSVRCFSQGLAAVQVSKNDELFWGFVNKKGDFEIQPQFDDVLFFTDGLCAVQRGGDWGFIDKNGIAVIPYRYSKVEMFKNGRAVYSNEGMYGLIDKHGNNIINPVYEFMDIDGNLFMIKQDGKMGWCDKNGKIVINPIYRDVQPFNGSSLAAVTIDGEKWGYINQKNETVIAPQFSSAFPFTKNSALASIDGIFYGMINKEGVFITESKFNIDPEYMPRYDYVLNEYMHVENQKIDLVSLLSLINFENPEGINLSSTISAALKWYNLSESDLQTDGDLHMANENYISDDMVLRTYIIATPYSNSGDRSSYNPNKLIEGIQYVVSGNSEDKNNVIYDEILNQLNNSASFELVYLQNLPFYKGQNFYVYVEKTYDHVGLAFFNHSSIDNLFSSKK